MFECLISTWEIFILIIFTTLTQNMKHLFQQRKRLYFQKTLSKNALFLSLLFYNHTH